MIKDRRNPTDELVEPRKRYKIFVGNNILPIPLNYEFTEGLNESPPDIYKELLTINMLFFNFNYLTHNYPINRYNFIAQTVIASSYGLMQAMHPTAVRANYKRPPTDLFIPNVAIDIGTRILHINFKKFNNTNDIKNVAEFHQYLVLMNRANQAYNGGTPGPGRPENYANSVEGFRIKYFPKKIISFFPN